MTPSEEIRMIPIDRIHILNPRVRNQKVFREMTDNIAKVGLKRPITVTPIKSKVEGKDYDLVCGQGRIEAFQACGQTHIPAIIIEATQEDALIMSLVENLARKQHRSLDILRGIEILQQKYDTKTIAEKTGLHISYVRAVLDLLNKGEERLLTAAEAGRIPLNVAVVIANSPEDEQRALQTAYENNELRGQKLIQARRLLEQRKKDGKALRYRKPCNKGEKISSQEVIAIYQKEVDRKRVLTRNAQQVNRQLLFITEALRNLYAEDHFLTILEAEQLATLPKQISLLLEARS